MIDGPIKRLIITAPPGSAKTRYTSHLLPPFALMRHPRWQIIGASHTSQYAELVSRKVQDYIRDNEHVLEYGLRTEAVGEWETSKGGTYFGTGVGGPLPGRRSDLAILDDLIKGREDAESQNSRDKAWDWFWGSLRHRGKPNSRIVLMTTRWHEDDLAGRLMKYQPGVWRVVNMKAQAEEDDPLGRAPSEWLWNDPTDEYGFGAELPGRKAEMEANGRMREWWSQYQGTPRAPDGILFKVQKFPVLPALPAGGEFVRAWDLASTAKIGTMDPDWTVGVKLGRMPDRSFVIADVVRFRGTSNEVEQAIRATAQQDGHGVRIGLPQDPGQAGKAQIVYLTSKLEGYTVISSTESGSKETRAMPVVSQAEVGNVGVLDRPWRAALLDELAGFPSGAKDDQVDALSRAFAMLVGAGPMVITGDVLARFRR